MTLWGNALVSLFPFLANKSNSADNRHDSPSIQFRLARVQKTLKKIANRVTLLLSGSVTRSSELL